jgi:ATP-binding protein involved in chromosome partitioning
VPFLGEIPIYTPIRVGSDTGRPIVVLEPDSSQAGVLRGIARNLAAQVSIRQYSDFSAPDIEIRLDG